MKRPSGISPGLPEKDQVQAAEFVTGVQPAAERAATLERIRTDAAFAAEVERWQEHLAPITGGIAEVPAPGTAWTAIEDRLFGAPAPAPAPARTAPDGSTGGLLGSLGLWRALAFAGLAGVAILVARPQLLAPPPAAPERQLAATLTSADHPQRFTALYSGATGELAVASVSDLPEPGKDFELWLIEEGQPPVSLGVVPPAAFTRVALPETLRARVAEGVTLAVTLEPQGGSTTGGPTGPLLAAGTIKNL